MSSLKIVGQADPADPGWWRSVEERQAGQAFLARALGEPGPAGPAGSDEAGLSRRELLQLLGASMALAGAAAGCLRNPPEKILPYTRKPEEITPGNPLHYASLLSAGGFATGVVVTSHEGRPTKIEGNPDHPTSRGATGLWEQAALLQLYDPARARAVKHRGQPRTFRAFLEAIDRLTGRGAAAAGGGRAGTGIHFLVEPDASPLLGSLRNRIQAALPGARFWAYAPLAADAAYEGARLCFGKPLETRVDLDRAEVVLSLDADFLCEGPAALRLAREWARHRVHPGAMSRLYAAESALTPTGAMADHRLRLRSADVLELALLVAARLVPELAPAAAQRPAGRVDPRFAEALARDLRAHAGRALVIVGPRQPPLVHALGHACNAALGAPGATVHYGAPILPDTAAGPAALAPLVAEMQAGRVETLVVTSWNPCYTAPADLDFAGALGRVPRRIYHGLYEDETAGRVDWFLPAAHPLESWGDGRSEDGTISIQQPLIAPLYGGTTAAEMLAAFLGEGDRGAHALLRAFWQTQEPGRAGADFERFWERSLHDGLVGVGAAEPERPTADLGRVAEAIGRAPRPAAGLELDFRPCAKLGDGRFANSGWLQELPEPLTKVTWDNTAWLSPTSASRLGLATGDVVALSLRDRTLELPVYVLPGHADDAVSIALGYGRGSGAEELAQGVGGNAYRLRPSDAPWFAGGLRLTRTGRRRTLAITQDHFTMVGRKLAIETTAAALRQRPGLLEELREPQPSLYPTREEPGQGYRWAMTIDLSRCTGCSACVLACQAENNIPVVGKEGVARGREMHWLRIDRYFEGSLEDPGMVTMPVACVHCENAPCEYVCPVNATVHSDEGLNEMVYNRCVGTRYCSNNCPYKVRRFNFFDYVGVPAPTTKMMANPEVTIRSRGVMEKCTYCVQRIERGRIAARVAGRPLADGEIRTACQQVCPTEAIVFGSLHDPESAVSRLREDPRAYFLLGELGTRPRTTHLARLRNPNPELG